MHPRLARTVRNLRASLWPLPLAAVAAGIGAGLLLPHFDRSGGVGDLPFLEVDAAMAQNYLGVLLGALATILGVVFSITIVALELASTQYSPRILGRFMADALTQWTLALFLGAVAYLLVAITGLPPDQPPRLTVTLGLLLGVASLGLLGVFLHHLARSIDAATIVRNIARDALASLRRLPLGPTVELPRASGPPTELRAERDGYLEFLHEEVLLAVAPPWVETMRVEIRGGDFVLPGTPTLSIWPALELDRRSRRKLHQAFSFARQRSQEQDLLYSVRQLVDISLKALSGQGGDLTTALMAVNELARLIYEFLRMGAEVEDRWRCVERALYVPTLGLRTMLRHCYGEIARASGAQLRVPARVLESMEEAIVACDPGPAQRAELANAARWIQESVHLDQGTPLERDYLEMRMRSLLGVAIGGRAPAPEPALH